jgi:hypothetical protein
MNRKLWICSLLSGTLVLAAGIARTQEPPPPRHNLMQQGPGPEGGPLGQRIELLGFEGMHGGKVVTGAPFSAVAISESTQTLADGNHITRKTQANLYRDSQGRFRKEVSFSAIGVLAEAGQRRNFIVIQDPVASVGYALDADQKVAHKFTFPGPRAAANRQNRTELRMQKQLAEGTLQKTDLGTQTINGLTVSGTRYTRTILAGQIGNEKPITIVSEQWYSNDLQTVVKSTRSDPRFGETTYTLTNIQRTEPNAALFQVPSEYTIKEVPLHKHGARQFKQAPPAPLD